MQNKKVAALIVLVVLAVISLIYGVTASPKGRAKNTAVAVVESRSAADSQGATNVVSTGRRAKRSQFKEWKRSPFVTGLAVPTVTKLTLNGIIWDKTRPKAMIGEAIVAKGDTIGSDKVVDIQPDRVILNDGTKNFELKIEK